MIYNIVISLCYFRCVRLHLSTMKISHTTLLGSRFFGILFWTQTLDPMLVYVVSPSLRQKVLKLVPVKSSDLKFFFFVASSSWIFQQAVISFMPKEMVSLYFSWRCLLYYERTFIFCVSCSFFFSDLIGAYFSVYGVIWMHVYLSWHWVFSNTLLETTSKLE